jgi:hypothetical protein
MIELHIVLDETGERLVIGYTAIARAPAEIEKLVADAIINAIQKIQVPGMGKSVLVADNQLQKH